MRVRARLTLLLLIAALLPGLALIGVFLHEQRPIRELFREHLEQQAVELTTLVERHFSERYSDVRAFALTAETALPDLAGPPDGGSKSPITAAMDRYVELYNVYPLMMLVGLDGQVRAVNTVDRNGNRVATEWLYGRGVAQSPWFQEILAQRQSRRWRNNGAVLLSPGRVDVLSELYGADLSALIFAAPVRSADGKVVALWVNFADRRLIRDILDRTYVEFTTQGLPSTHLWLVDSDGKLLMGRDKTGIAWTADTANGGPPPSLAAAVANLGTRGTKVVQDPRTGADEIIGYARTPESEQQPRLAVAAIVDVAADEAFAPLDATFREMLAGAAGILLLALILGGLVGSRFARPIRRLTGAMGLVAKGDTSAAVPELRRHDEIGDMARSLEVFRQNAEVLRQAQKMEAIGQLTGGIAHDFNNLLTVIIGNLERLAARVAGHEETAKLVATAASAADRGAKLTQYLLAFARRQHLKPQLVDVNEVITGMQDLVSRALGEKVTLERHLAPGLWQAWVDPNQLEAALLNLLLNARDAMPEGGRIALATANVNRDDFAPAGRGTAYVQIAVRDTGKGMPPQVRARAFEPFFTTKPVGKGTGLGLSMVQGFVAQSEGQVEIKSEIGAGTDFRIFLPRAEPRQINAARRSPNRGAGD